MFQSSPVPKDGCNFDVGKLERLLNGVSILTRPEGRVQPARGISLAKSGRFNPHPSRRTGATAGGSITTWTANVSILTRPEGRVQLNLIAVFAPNGRFQSSPVPKDGCNKSGGRRMGVLRVSILTRPEGRVQRGCPCNRPRLQFVSILTRPEGRVQLGRGWMYGLIS